MNPLKRNTAILLGGSLALAVLTPLYISYAVPGSAVYHRNLFVFGMQATPYVVCAAIWLPWRDPRAPKVAFRLSLVLFAVACLLYLPSWVRPRTGGDMVVLGYLLICLVTTVAIVGFSVAAVIAFWWSGRRNVASS